MAKNAGESRIPVPRAVRPSFLPKSRLVGSSKIGSHHQGHRRSNILSSCLTFTEHDDGGASTQRGKFPGGLFASSPSAKRKLADTTFTLPHGVWGDKEHDVDDTTFTIPSVWTVKENDAQDSPFLEHSEDKIFSNLHETSQMNIIEDVAESCLLDLNLGPFNETSTPASSTPHYLMLNQKQNSFEHDESLGILTPDQMTDFTLGTLGCSRTPSCENITGGLIGSRLGSTRGSSSRPLETEVVLTSPENGEPTEGSSERTPSPEELPLDPKPIENSTRTVPSSFVTSVTSITSLEAGYQGDGENSRPASRGGDPPQNVPMPSNMPPPCRQDPMTDSDFFTESDADAHEEIVRGDRRAQVIDGTLFCAPGGRRCPSFTGEEMDSSGIYSDLEKRQDEMNAELIPSEDRTPDTVDTEVSQRSQPSPVKPEVILNFLQTPKRDLDGSGDSNASNGMVETTVIEVVNEVTCPKSVSKQDPAALKKYKMPKRNVVSKIKAMIESGTKEENEKEQRRLVRSPRKNGRWDAVMSKIEAGKNEQRSRPMRKEVKSRVLQSLGPSSSSSSSATTASTRRLPGDANNNNNANNKDKRRTRTRQGLKSPNQETARSSVRSSMTDLSSGAGKDGRKRSPTTGNQPRRVTNGRTSTNNQQQARINNCDPKKSCPEVSTLNLDKSPTPVRKTVSTGRTGPINSLNAKLHNTNATTTTKDRTAKENNVNANNIIRNPPVLETRHQSAQTDNSYETLREKRIDDTIQGLSVTVQYLAHELDGFAAPRLRKDCESMKSEWLTARTEVEDLRTSQVNLEERLIAEREDHRRALEELRAELEAGHAERVNNLESALNEEKANFTERLESALAALAAEHEATIAQLKRHHEAEIIRRDTKCQEECVDQKSQNNWNDAAETEKHEEEGDKEKEEEQGEEEEDGNEGDEESLEKLSLREQLHQAKTALNLKNVEYTKLQTENEELRDRLEEKKILRERIESLQWQVRNTLSESRKEHLTEMAKLRAEYEAVIEKRENESDRKSFVHDQGAALRAEVWSLRSVLELRSQENATLRTENDSLRREVEGKEALEQRVECLEARCEDLKAQLDSKESYERQISHENEILLGSFHEVSMHNKHLSQRNEELQWRLRQKNEVVNVLANQLATPPQRLSRSLGPEHMENSLDRTPIEQTLNGDEEQPMASSMVKFMVQKGDSVSWTLEIDESSDSLTSAPTPTGPTVSRQNSLRSASRKKVDLRTRSKSVSMSESSRDQVWSPGYNSTPVSARRRPRSDPAQTANDVGVAANVNVDTGSGPRPQEAGGEAMISEETSATSSEDESSTSSDIPRLTMDFPWSKDNQ